MTQLSRGDLLATTAAALLAVTIATSAQAATTNVVGGGSSLAAPTYGALFKLEEAGPSPGANYEYFSVGSGKGQAGFLNNDSTQFGIPAGTTVDFGASDAFLSEAQISAYDSSALATTAKGGPLIQLPAFGTPITLPFNKVTGTAKVTITDAKVCGIFSGKITDWHQVFTTAPIGTTIKVVYRSDNSGTTFLLTQHLAAVCTSSTSNITWSATQSFASLFPNATPPANFTGATGSAGVQTALLASSNTFGYLSPDYTSLAPKSSNTSSLLVASIYNSFNNKAYQPTYSNTSLALGNAPPPSNPADQTQWVPSVPNPTTGYPIVGYTTLEFSTCYKDANVATYIHNFLRDMYGIKNGPNYVNTIEANGFTPITSAFANAIDNNFLTNNTHNNLDFNDKTVCKAGQGR